MSFLVRMLAGNTQLTPRERSHLLSANLCLGKGDTEEARQELSKISTSNRTNPDVLCVSWKIYSTSGNWELAAETAKAIAEQMPGNELGSVLLAQSLHKLGRTKEARDTLIATAHKFPEKYLIHYDLARYCCALGDLSEAWRWLEKVLEAPGSTEEIILLALYDPDLKPLLGDTTEGKPWRTIAATCLAR